jgi:hypothetical protein
MIQGVLKHVFRINREFHDTDLSSTVAFAFHSIAIDERRQPFLPTVWTQSDDGVRAGQHIEQVWFPGCHPDVGGGESSSDLSDLTLAWMADRARKAGLALLPVETIGPPDFAKFSPSEIGRVQETLTWFYRLFFPSGVRKIDATGEATREAISSEALTRWGALPQWRPAALLDYFSRKGGPAPNG